MSNKFSKPIFAAIVLALALGAGGVAWGTIGYTGGRPYKSVAAANLTGLFLEQEGGVDVVVEIPKAAPRRVLKVLATLLIRPSCGNTPCSSDTDAYMRATVGGQDLFPVDFNTVCKLDRDCTLTAIWWEDVDTMLADGRATKRAPLPVTIHMAAGDFSVSTNSGIIADGQLSVLAELVKK